MISVAYTLLLVSLVFGTVPSAWAAPVGTRNMDVKAMRRMATEPAPIMRREHHSATSYVPRDDDPIPVVAARARDPELVTPEPTPRRGSRRHRAKHGVRGTDAPSRPMPRFKRDEVSKRVSAEQPEVVARKEDAANSDIARDGEQAKRTLPYRVGTVVLPADGSLPNPPPVQRSEAPEKRHQSGGHHGTPEKRLPADGSLPNPPPVQRSEAPEKRHQSGGHHGTPEKREEVKDTVTKRGPIKTIALFRRALAYENLD